MTASESAIEPAVTGVAAVSGGVEPGASPRQLARTITGYAPAYVLPAVLGLAVIPILTRSLGPAEFGAYGVSLSLHGVLLTLAADPTTNATRRLFARAAERGEGDRLLRAILGLALAMATVVAVTTLALTLTAAALFDIGPWLGRISALAGMTAAFAVFQYALTGMYVKERVRATSTTQMVHAVLKAGALIGGALAFRSTAGSLATYGVAVALLAAWLIWRTLRTPFPLFDRARWEYSLRYGTPLIGVSLSWIVLVGFDRFIVAVLSGERAAGQYTVAYLISDFSVASAGIILSYAYYPSLVRFWERGQRDAARRTLRGAVDVFLVFGSTVVVALAVAGSEVTKVAGGKGFPVPSLVPVLVGAGVLLYRMAQFEAIGFEFALRSKGLAATFGMAAGLCLPLTVGAVALAGLRGAALSTLLSFALFWALVRRRCPLSEVTAYPLRRFLAVVAIGAAVVLAARQLPTGAGFGAALAVQPLLTGALLLWLWRGDQPTTAGFSTTTGSNP